MNFGMTYRSPATQPTRQPARQCHAPPTAPLTSRPLLTFVLNVFTGKPELLVSLGDWRGWWGVGRGCPPCSRMCMLHRVAGNGVSQKQQGGETAEARGGRPRPHRLDASRHGLPGLDTAVLATSRSRDRTDVSTDTYGRRLAPTGGTGCWYHASCEWCNLPT
jgi:hypothetical protein